MRPYSLDSHLADVYAHFHGAQHRPVVGITGNYDDLTCRLGEGYYKQVIAAGGTPLIIPPTPDAATLLSALDHIDALLLSGGADINPLYAGEEPSPRLGGINSERDLPELLITRLAYHRQLPILGICRGIQTLAVALGGRVAQDLSELAPAAEGAAAATPVKHAQQAPRSEATHTVTLERGSILHRLYGDGGQADSVVLPVNSFHHQAVAAPGERFTVTARAADGVIEAMESSEMKAIMGVQWHPECMGQSGLPLFEWLVAEGRAYREAQQLHDRMLTLDSHCDTPMFFPQGIDFGTRDERILVDLPKMSEGRLDATVMVAYVPQPKAGETFAQIAPFAVEGPRAYADLIFDKIEQMVATHDAHLALARTPDDLWRHKQQGRKSIMLGIENGLALEGQPALVEHFARRGVVYITLCHNGDNELCDSAARSAATHHGVSPIGEQVISEMNRLGLMVDLSHAGEKSFFDALAMSKTPIVCSHSSARACCDHVRNLTDEQMRALARAGGVAQITLYHGFLRTEGEATILDAMAHLEHAIKVMGIEHVGLGTDFDGDGGVRGLADASELMQFTRQLLMRRYTPADIALIWGGNFLRVMRQVQAAAHR